PPETVAKLRTGSWTPSEELFRTAKPSVAGRDLFRAQSLIYFHYFHDKRLMKELGDYFNLARNQHAPTKKAIATAFGMDPDRLDKAVRDYFVANVFEIGRMAPPFQETAENWPIDDVTPQEMRTAAADVHSHLPGSLERAAKEYQVLLQEDPRNGPASRG